MIVALFKRLLNYWSTPKHIAVYVVLTSAVALTAAYISQYGFGLDPCILCYYQRIPYFSNIAVGIIALVCALYSKRAAFFLLCLCGLIFLVDSGIALFHVGVEYTWWKGLEACGNAAMPVGATVEEMRAFINSRDIVRCDVPAFTLFGISMAGYNFLLSLGFAICTFTLLWWQRKKNYSA